jgi:hypothetical protein
LAVLRHQLGTLCTSERRDAFYIPSSLVALTIMRYHHPNLLQLLVAVLLIVPCSLAEGSQEPITADDGSTDRARPNIVFILTDDQDLHMDSLSYMPNLQEHLIKQGTYFRRHYCTVALCCPSRASLWTGKAAHNTNVTDINPPYGKCPFPRAR